MIYVLRNYKIYQTELIKPSRKNKGWWCRLDNHKKLKLVSIHKMFNSFKEANEFLKELTSKNK